MNKKTFKIIIVIVMVLVMTLNFSVLGHSGGTDSLGGHLDHSTGEYHYHHGNPAHQHYNDICPYKVKDIIIVSIPILIFLIYLGYLLIDSIKDWWTKRK